MISDHFDNIKGLILDMDGVLWQDTEPLGDLPRIFDNIQTSGLKTILVTNNATRTVDEYHDKLARFGVKLDDWQIINSAQAVGNFLREKYPDGENVFVIGEQSLKNTLREYGFSVVSEKKNDIKVVVASLDYSLTYEKLKYASLLIQSGCEFIGTNPDKTLPTPNGFIPGSGTIISALEIASGKSARIIGKPEPLLYQMAIKRLGVDSGNTLAVGDRLETDIAGAAAAGIHTALVLSGASSLEQAQNYRPNPEIITRDLTELIC